MIGDSPAAPLGSAELLEVRDRLERRIAELRGWVLLLAGMDSILFVMVFILLVR